MSFPYNIYQALESGEKDIVFPDTDLSTFSETTLTLLWENIIKHEVELLDITNTKLTIPIFIHMLKMFVDTPKYAPVVLYFQESLYPTDNHLIRYLFRVLQLRGCSVTTNKCILKKIDLLQLDLSECDVTKELFLPILKTLTSSLHGTKHRQAKHTQSLEQDLITKLYLTDSQWELIKNDSMLFSFLQKLQKNGCEIFVEIKEPLSKETLVQNHEVRCSI